MNEIRDRIVRVQDAIDNDVAKEISLDLLSNKLEALSRVQADTLQGAPEELAQEARQRLEAAVLSTRLLQVLKSVSDRGVTTPADLAGELNLKPNTCSQYLNELATRGHVRKLAYGKYAPEPSHEHPDAR